MQVQAISKSVPMSPRKIRLVARLLSNMQVEEALRRLSLLRKRPSLAIEKTVRSALANAAQSGEVNLNLLRIKQVEVSEGGVLKRFHPSTRGRVHPYKRRKSHIRVILEDTK